METGDLLLFRWKGWKYYLNYLFGSRYAHAGIYVKDPKTFHQDLPDGEYILHTTFVQRDAKVIYDIHLEKLDEAMLYYGEPDYKKIHAPRNKYFYTMLEELFHRFQVRRKDETLFDWLASSDNEVYHSAEYYRYTQQFWSSALVVYVYKHVDWVRSIDWYLVSPSNLDHSCLIWRFPAESPRDSGG